MMKLEDFKLTPAEEALTEHMPEQVAIGYIRASRRAYMSRSKKKNGKRK